MKCVDFLWLFQEKEKREITDSEVAAGKTVTE